MNDISDKFAGYRPKGFVAARALEFDPVNESIDATRAVEDFRAEHEPQNHVQVVVTPHIAQDRTTRILRLTAFESPETLQRAQLGRLKAPHGTRDSWQHLETLRSDSRRTFPAAMPRGPGSRDS
jgi:hypothetical protein